MGMLPTVEWAEMCWVQGRREAPSDEVCGSSQRGELRGRVGLSRSLQRSVGWWSQQTRWMRCGRCEGILCCLLAGLDAVVVMFVGLAWEQGIRDCIGKGRGRRVFLVAERGTEYVLCTMGCRWRRVMDAVDDGRRPHFAPTRPPRPRSKLERYASALGPPTSGKRVNGWRR